MNLKNKLKMRSVAMLTLLFGISFFFYSCNDANTGTKQKTKKIDAKDIVVEGEMDAELTHPPFVPKSTANRKATKLKVDMEILEFEDEMMNGVKYTYWTFGGSVPGQFIRAKLGDEIEFRLKNHPDNKLPHNIDLHAVNGPGGGAVSSFVAPGRETVFSFKTLNPGLYVYHCATAPVGMHIANGMYGLILVEPEEGLPEVDHEFYIMQGDFYTEGSYGEKGHQAFDMQKAMDEIPDYVVFNGKVNALTGANALQAKPGETVRLYVGNGGPNLVSSFHVIGEIMDRVHLTGGDLVDENVQTFLIPAGGAAIAEFKLDVPGEYTLVDHSIFRAFNKGALGVLNVTGEEDKHVYAGTLQEGIYKPEGGKIQRMPSVADANGVEIIEEMSFDEKMESGKQLYNQTCAACHQPEGQGIAEAFPPLAKADYLNEDVHRAIEIVKQGKAGEIIVNGEKYNSVMPSQNLTDAEIASVLTYIYNSWDNNETEVTLEMVHEASK